MSDWTVHLEFEEGNSSKFWRARVEGKTLYVNYGKIGANGQTQVKDFPSSAAAQSEYDKLVREKKKKGYAEAGGGGGDDDEKDDDDADESGSDDEEGGDEADDDDDDDDDDDEKPKKKLAAKPAPAPAAKPAGQRMVLESGNRKVEAYVSLDGKTLRMDSIETYATPEAAKKAQERLKKMLAGEGYKEG